MSSLARNRTMQAGRLSVRIAPRSVNVGAVLLVALVVVGGASLSLGDYHVPLSGVLRALTGSATGYDDFIVNSLRLPRWLTGLCVGAALGIGGALFQSLSRNPLGSPDIVGFDVGAATGALLVILVWHGSAVEVSLGAVVGGVGTALLVYLLAIKRGVQGYRLVLIGIGIAAMLLAVNDYLITRADLNDAQAAASWIIGSLNGRTFAQVWPILVVLGALLLPAMWLGRELRMLELGDDAARALGVPAEPVRLASVVVGVGLVAVGAASAGPIAFVALAAPQVARRLTARPGPNVVPSALVGALLLTASDLVAQHLFSQQLPVGAVTGAVGGLYLAWVLSRQWRGGRG